MIDVQNIFNDIVELLERYRTKNDIVANCYESVNLELVFSFIKMPASHISGVYKSRQSLENLRKGNEFVIGYDDLIPNLEATNDDEVIVTNISSEKGTFIVFTNVKFTELLGVLKSKRTLSEIRNKYKNHEQRLEKSNFESTNDYKKSENVFIDGKLVITIH